MNPHGTGEKTPLEEFKSGEYSRDIDFKSYLWCGKTRVNKGRHEIGRTKCGFILFTIMAT